VLLAQASDSTLLAFDPAPLPPDLPVGLGLLGVLEKAALALGRLDGIGSRLLDPALFVRPMLSREAVYSSRIEGTVASVEDLALFEADPATGRDKPSVIEVWNYLSAAERGMERIRSAPDAPVDLEFIAWLHKTLMAGVQRSNEVTPGEFRHVQNWIGKQGTPIEKARYIPPPPEEMFGGLESLVWYIAQPDEAPALLRTALVHYQFEAIHPFRDGNGRVGRLLITILMAKWGLLKLPLLHLSAFFERHQGEYQDRLLEVSQRGAWAAWVEFFATGVAEEATSAGDRANRLLALREAYRQRARSVSLSPNAPILADWLFTRPLISIPDAARHLNVTYPPTQRIVEQFVKAGILVERPGPGTRIFAAPEVLALTDAG
jgi:Fic family protein